MRGVGSSSRIRGSGPAPGPGPGAPGRSPPVRPRNGRARWPPPPEAVQRAADQPGLHRRRPDPAAGPLAVAEARPVDRDHPVRPGRPVDEAADEPVLDQAAVAVQQHEGRPAPRAPYVQPRAADLDDEAGRPAASPAPPRGRGARSRLRRRRAGQPRQGEAAGGGDGGGSRGDERYVRTCWHNSGRLGWFRSPARTAGRRSPGAVRRSGASSDSSRPRRACAPWRRSRRRGSPGRSG